MYIHNYYKNPAFYDIYDYDWDNNDPGNLPDLGPGNDRGYKSYVFPQGWSTDPKSIAPLGADRSPPWHQTCIPLRRYNNIATDFGIQIGWENIPQNNPGEFGTSEFTKGTDLINNYNAGQSSNATPIWDGEERSYLMACGHCLQKVGRPHLLVKGLGYNYWFFMNPDGETFRVIVKELHDMTRIDPLTGEPVDVTFFDDPTVNCAEGCTAGFGCWQEPDENQGRCYHRGFTMTNQIAFGDTLILEIDTIEKVTVSDDGLEQNLVGTGEFFPTMESIGCPPISKTINVSPSVTFNADKDIPVMWGPDRQGRAVVGINRNPLNTATLASGSASGRDGNAPMLFQEYMTLWSGDSGTAGWINTKSGWVYVTLFAAGGDLVKAESVMKEKLDSQYTMEYVDINVGSDYEVLDYFEHPDIEYSQSPTGGDDADSNTFIPVIPDLNVKVKTEYTDESGNNIDYTAESNEIETTNTTLPVDPGNCDFVNLFDINGNEFDFGSDVNFYSDGLDFVKVSLNFINGFETTREDFKMFSFEEDFGDSCILFIDGISMNEIFPIPRIGKFRFTKLTIDPGSNSTSKIFKASIISQLLINHENVSFFERGVEYPVTVKYTNSRTSDEINFDAGNIIFAETPENIRLEYDESELYPGNQLTINLVTDNVPIPDLTFRSSDIVNATPDLLNIDSVDDNTITATVTGDVGEQIALSISVFWGYDESVNRINQYGSPLPFIPLIGEPPAITAQLEVNPDVNNDGIANTYEDSIDVVTDSEVSKYMWKTKINII
tara:strand:+ start:230 stop:2557 length:2328 start_codon:yes stop_codon:yes gene_type:complete